MEMKKERPAWTRGKCIGRGSFGTVSLAVDKSDGRVFAVKSVDRRSSAALSALENEIRILRSVKSPYVVEYLGDDVTRESPTVSFRNLHLEYLPGGTVADLAAGKLDDVDERLVRSYTSCVVSALRYLHSEGVVHCDVKGRNILVGAAAGVAKLADFGSAVEIGGDRGDKIVPRGSPLWMAPEVIRGEFQGPESDVWSLGCTVIEMVSGAPAWEDRGADTLRRIGFSDDLPVFPSRLSELGRDFVEKCLLKDPRQRWSCDRLLQHPFLTPPAANSIDDSSPRCVLDWFSSDFSEDDDEEACSSRNWDSQSNCEKHGAPASDRIRELASSRGPNWAAEGWEAVRYFADDRAKGMGGGDETEETISEYRNLIGTVEETGGTTPEYSNSEAIREGTRLEYYNSGRDHGFGWFEAGFSCRFGWLPAGSSAEGPGMGFNDRSILFLFLIDHNVFAFNLLFFHFSLYILYSPVLSTRTYECDKIYLETINTPR
ncbi:mitogen-activated protein kinase kinase kinase 18-like [Malania oleifera]|uniref:mitogen-activated protein kinase kinase kinase 18-like n=1 Tax=Malania oleifera TaxID=397392 RepID=UPI0025AE2E06|nr:mitogen-activated protein kinase kinase kinase 18-like [Malania oleifera]